MYFESLESVFKMFPEASKSQTEYSWVGRMLAWQSRSRGFDP